MNKKKLNILLTTDHYPPTVNGIVTHVLLVKNELEKRGHTVSILTASFKKSPQKNVYLLPSVPSLIRKTDPITIPFHSNIEQSLLNQKFDIVHDHLMLTGFMGMRVAKKLNIPTVLTVHTTFNTFIDYIFPHPVNRIFYPSFDLLARWYMKKHTLILAPSTKSLNELHRLGLKKQSQLLFNGILLPEIESVNANKFLEKYSLKKDDRLITLVGRVDRGKNVDLAVKSLVHVKQKYPSVKLAIIGDGNQMSAIKKLINRLDLNDNVLLTGFIDRDLIASANKAAELFVFPSDTDNLPTVVIEAIALGKPVVAVNDEAIKHLAIPGKNAEVVNKNEYSFAEAINKLLGDRQLVQSYKKNSLSISKDFSVEEHVNKLETIYQNLIDENKKH